MPVMSPHNRCSAWETNSRRLSIRSTSGGRPAAAKRFASSTGRSAVIEPDEDSDSAMAQGKSASGTPTGRACSGGDCTGPVGLVAAGQFQRRDRGTVERGVLTERAGEFGQRLGAYPVGQIVSDENGVGERPAEYDVAGIDCGDEAYDHTGEGRDGTTDVGERALSGRS